MNYRKYSDKDLLESYSTALDYSGNANDELLKEIDSRGGIDQVKKNVSQQNVIPNEIKRINQLVFVLYKSGGDTNKIKSSVTSDILTADQLNNTIEKAIIAADKYIKNHSINAKTILGSLIGMSVSVLVGAAILCYTVMQTGNFYYAIPFGIFIISYAIIWLLTKQNRNNVVVFIASFAAAFISVPLGLWICNLVMQ
ncbi:hypothetical protein QEG73_05540 [Chitinophagaceae bacterium 26-R-25]|nr:hypothetical protein [Chitinophagaceae bacterium 26-R-25]